MSQYTQTAVDRKLKTRCFCGNAQLAFAKEAKPQAVRVSLYKDGKLMAWSAIELKNLEEFLDKVHKENVQCTTSQSEPLPEMKPPT